MVTVTWPGSHGLAGWLTDSSSWPHLDLCFPFHPGLAVTFLLACLPTMCLCLAPSLPLPCTCILHCACAIQTLTGLGWTGMGRHETVQWGRTGMVTVTDSGGTLCLAFPMLWFPTPCLPTPTSQVETPNILVSMEKMGRAGRPSMTVSCSGGSFELLAVSHFALC